MSRARDANEVSGIKWWRRACWAETSRSHSKAIADARCGLLWGTVRISFVGRRSGRLSRWICSPSNLDRQKRICFAHEVNAYHPLVLHERLSKISLSLRFHCLSLPLYLACPAHASIIPLVFSFGRPANLHVQHWGQELEVAVELLISEKLLLL